MNIYNEVMDLYENNEDIEDVWSAFQVVFEDIVVNGGRYKDWYRHVDTISREISRFDEVYRSKMRCWVRLELTYIKSKICESIRNDVKRDFVTYSQLIHARKQFKLDVYPCGYEWIHDIDVFNSNGYKTSEFKHALIKALIPTVDDCRKESRKVNNRSVRFADTLDDQVKDDREIISAPQNPHKEV